MELLSTLLGVLGLPWVAQAIQRTRRRWRHRRTGSYAERWMERGMNDIEREAKSLLYYYPGGYISALRLWGAQDQGAGPGEISVQYHHEPLQIDPALQGEVTAAIDAKRQAAEREGRLFFNGPCARLIGWRADVPDDDQTAKERERLCLTMGPVGWFDYEGLSAVFRGALAHGAPQYDYRSCIGLEQLLRERSAASCRLSNILDVAVTLITTDGYAAYAVRGGRVAVDPGWKTSAVAENINRLKDDVLEGNAELSSWNGSASPAEQPLVADASYEPHGVPHPYAAARRGIACEVSPLVAGWVKQDALRLTGISFDLRALHPDALFVAFVDATKPEVELAARQSPGAESHEGSIRWVPADLNDEETISVLSQPDWIPAGQASLFRALEYTHALDGRCVNWPIGVARRRFK